MRIGVGEFKARCLGLLEELHLEGGEIVLTKRGRPFAKVVPFDDHLRPPVSTLARSGRLTEGPL